MMNQYRLFNLKRTFGMVTFVVTFDVKIKTAYENILRH